MRDGTAEAYSAAFDEMFAPDMPQVTTVKLEKLLLELSTHLFALDEKGAVK